MWHGIAHMYKFFVFLQHKRCSDVIEASTNHPVTLEEYFMVTKIQKAENSYIGLHQGHSKTGYFNWCTIAQRFPVYSVATQYKVAPKKVSLCQMIKKSY